MKRFRYHITLPLLVVGLGLFAIAARADEQPSVLAPVPLVRDAEEEKASAEREAIVTRIVSPEALKVMSRHFGATEAIFDLEVIAVRYYENFDVEEYRMSSWSRADFRITSESGKVVRYWPGRKETFVANEENLFVTDSRFLNLYTKETFTDTDIARRRWKDAILKNSDLEAGALGWLGSQHNEFAAVLLDRNLISVSLGTPQIFDGTLCDVLEIRRIDVRDNHVLHRLAISKDDSMARMMEFNRTDNEGKVSLVRETYHELRVNWNLSSINETSLNLFQFKPKPGMKRVDAFPTK